MLTAGIILNNCYEILELIGSGSQGNVYIAERIKDKKKFVLKEVKFSSETDFDAHSIKEIFFREAEFMSRFEFPGLPKMHGIFSQDGRDYLVMDYIEGKTLEDIINSSENPVAEEKALRWAIEIALILDYLHNSFHSPVVYRDLKPSNIIITPSDHAVLVDFGIVRYYNPDKNTDTFSCGSPGYAAPEQYKGRGQTSPRTDVFGLGVILYEMLTRYDPSLKPFVFSSIRDINPSVSSEAEEIIFKAIELAPDKRYGDIREFKVKLQKCLEMKRKRKNSMPVKPVIEPSINLPSNPFDVSGGEEEKNFYENLNINSPAPAAKRNVSKNNFIMENAQKHINKWSVTINTFIYSSLIFVIIFFMLVFSGIIFNRWTDLFRMWLGGF